MFYPVARVPRPRPGEEHHSVPVPIHHMDTVVEPEKAEKVDVYQPIPEATPVIPAEPMARRNRMATVLMLFLAGLWSMVVFITTSKYSSGVQGQQYMLSFLFACIFHFVIEALRAAMVHKMGTFQGKKYYPTHEAKQEEHEETQSHHGRESEVELFEDFRSVSEPYTPGKNLTTPFPGGRGSERYNPDTSPTFMSHTQSMLNTGGSVRGGSAPAAPMSSVMASVGRGRSSLFSIMDPPPPSAASNSSFPSIAAVNRRGLGRGRNPLESIVASEDHFVPTTVSVNAPLGRGRGTRSLTPPMLSGGAEPPQRIFTQYSSRGQY
eukprot:TRINITY_DN25074_c0_g1_i1.p1 TRINITY_DN25074_c0_g1~~TRINITY_DN25074_c0_g1_i1.p1  ORF type:complete len:348 (+),score=57.55 TRINITY_DN25074_c0_g1_i1:83-1045(+)